MRVIAGEFRSRRLASVPGVETRPTPDRLRETLFDILMPIIGKSTGGIDFSSKFIMLGEPPASYKGSLTNYAALKAAGVPLLGYGAFINAVINFVILAFVIFLIIRQANKMMPPPQAAPVGPSEVELLAEIRDELKRR